MKAIETPLPGVLLLEPKTFGDARGFFLESWNRKTFADLGLDPDFVQDNHSRVRPKGCFVACITSSTTRRASWCAW